MAGRRNTVNMRIHGWEAALIGPLVPYLLMVGGSFITLAVAWGLRWWTYGRPGLTALITFVLIVTGATLSVGAWKLFKPLTGLSGPAWGLAHHVVATIVLSHQCIYLFMVLGSRELTWSLWAIGSLFVIVSWAIRRLARLTAQQHGHDADTISDQTSLTGSHFLGQPTVRQSSRTAPPMAQGTLSRLRQ